MVVKAPRFAFEKFPGADADADHHDEVRWRGNVVGPQLHRGARQGDALPGDRAAPGSGPAPDPDVSRRRAAGGPQDPHRRTALRHRAGAAPRRHRRAGGRGLRRRPVVRRADRRTRHAAGRAAGRAGARRAPAAAQQALRPVGPPDRRAATGIGRRGRRAGAAPAARHPPGVQDRRHLRGRVRGQDALSLQQLRTRPRRRDRGRAAGREAEGAHPRLGTEPHRAGHRVRLQLRARGDHIEPGRVRDGDGQLQPRDGVHRLRHRRPALLRTADLRGRPRGLLRRISNPAQADLASSASSFSSVGRPRWALPNGSRRPACRSSAPVPRPSTWPRTAARSAKCSTPRGCRRPSSAWPPASSRPAGSPPISATRCWSGRPTCWAAAAWRSSTTKKPWRVTSPAPPNSRPSTRCWSTDSSRTPSRSTSTRSATAPRCTSAESWSTSRKPASTRATRRARCRR